MSQQPSTQQLADEFDAFVAQQGQQSGGGEFASNEDAARWLDVWMRQIDRAPVEQTFRQGLQMGTAGTAGTLARSARLPFEFGDALLEWLDLGPDIAGPVKAVLDATTASGRMAAGIASAGGEALQGYAQRVGQEFDEPTFAGSLGQAAGSAAVMAPASIVGGALGPAVGLGAGLAGSLAGGGVGAAISSEGLLERAEGLGAGPGQRMGAMAAGAPIGAIESFGAQKYLGELGQILKGGSREVVQRVALELSKAAGKSFLSEGGEELAQGLAEEAVAAWILEDPEARDRGLGDWLARSGEVALDEGVPGGVIGALMGGMARAGAIQQARGQAVKPAPLVDQIEPAGPAMQEDTKRGADPEWAGVREAMEGQNQTPLRFVQPATEDQKRTATLAQRLGVEVGFVEPYTPEADRQAPTSADTETDSAALTRQVSESDLASKAASSELSSQPESLQTDAMSGMGEQDIPEPPPQSAVPPNQRPNPKPARKPAAPRALVARIAESLKRASSFQSRYQGNKADYFQQNAERLARFLAEDAADAEVLFDWYVGGGTYGLTLATADGAVPNLKRAVLNEIDPLKRLKLETQAKEGQAFVGLWLTDPLLIELSPKLQALIGKSSSPAALAVDVALGEAESDVHESFLAYRDRIKQADPRVRAALQAMRDVMFSGRTKKWGNLLGTAMEDANRFKAVYDAAVARGIAVEFVSLDAKSPEAVRMVQEAGKSLVVLDPPYFGTSGATYRAGDRDIDFGSPEFLQQNLESANAMSDGNAVLYNNSGFPEVQQQTKRVFGNRMRGTIWVRDGKHQEFVGYIDGSGQSSNVDSDVGPGDVAGQPEAAVQRPEVVGEAASDTGRQPGRGAEGDAGGARRDAARPQEQPRERPRVERPVGPLRYPAAYMRGRVAIDSRSATPKRLLFHEGLHHLAANNAPGFARLLAAMTDLKPEKIAAARRAYAQAFGEGAPTGAALDEEAAAVFSEDLAGVLEKAFDDPAKLTRVLSDRNVFEVVRDWIARIAKTFGGSMQTTLEKRLAAVDAVDDAEVKLALLWKDTIDAIQSEMRASEVEAAVRNDAKFAAAYHGTPFDFDRFSTEKIGTGEGAQAYGWGLYFAGNREIAEHYRKKLTNPRITLERVARESYNSDMEPDEAEASFMADVAASPGLTASERALVAQAKADGWYGFDYPHQAIKAVLGKDAENYDLSPEIRPILEAIKVERRGRLYEVELAPAEDEYLLWDKPLSEQSEKVKAALLRMADANVDMKGWTAKRNTKYGSRDWSVYDANGELVNSLRVSPTYTAAEAKVAASMERHPRPDRAAINADASGKVIYERMSSSASTSSMKQASMALRAAGIRGIKYLDGSSRAQGEGHYNYVIFDESDVTVKAKFAVAPPTDSPEFKRWFRNSKVVDADGKPLVVYHGTPNGGFTAFEQSGRRDRGWFGRGFNFAEDKATADMYRYTTVFQKTGRAKTYSVYLAIQSPLVVEEIDAQFVDRAIEELQRRRARFGREPLSAERVEAELRQPMLAAIERGNAILIAKEFSDSFGDLTNYARALGYDGIHTKAEGRTWIAFRPEQIKSATGNRGTFDPANPDIRFAVDRERIEAATAQARAEGEETEIGSKPSRIADTQADPDQRAMRRGVREVRAEGEEVVTLEEQRRRSESVTNEEAIEKARSGQALQAHEQIALDRARVEHATGALKSGAEADILRAIDTEWTYQDVRRDTARALGGIRDALRAQTPAETVAEFAFELSPDLRIRIERATKRLKTAQEKGRTKRVEIEQATIKRLKGIEAQRVQKAIAALKAQGFDMALLTADYLNDPTIAARIARTIYTSKSPKFDWYKESVLSSMLSALGTQVVNPTGNFMNTSVEQVATRLGAVMSNTVVRDPNSPSWGETAAFFKAFNAASMKAGRVFLQSMRTDMPVFEIELRRQGVVVPEDQGAKLDVGRAAIPGAAGRAIRFPSLTMMRATDEAARAFSYITEGTALAFRAAKNEGVTGDALAARTLEILNGPYRADVHGSALEMADRMTFRDKDDPVTKRILEVRKMADTLIGAEKHGFFPAGTMFMPFVSFGAKSLRTAVGLPVHPAVTFGRLLARTVNQGPYVGDTPRAVQDVGRSMVSLLLLYGLLGLVRDEDERGVPRITGTSRPYERDNTVAPPMSVRIGDRWYSYERLDPASTSIATIVDALQEEDVGAGFARALHSLGNTVADKSYLATLGAIVDALSEPDAETWQERAAKFGVRSIVLPMIPNLVRSTATATDEFQRVTAARKESEDDGIWDVMGRELDYRILPTGARAPAIKYDTWGRPMARPGRTFFERLLSPAKTTGSVDHATDVDVLIWRYNQRFERGEIVEADARRYVPRPPDFHYMRRDGSKGYWTDEEYDRLQREAGQEALETLRSRRLNFESPEWDDIERIRKAVSDARSRVKRSMLRESQAAEVAQQ